MSTQPPPLSLHRLTFVSALTQDLVADDLSPLRTRHDRLKTRQTTLGALVTFSRGLPPARQPRLWQDVTRLTPVDVDAWLQSAPRQGLAPSTIHTTRSVVRRFCTFLQEHTRLAHPPIHPRRHEVLVPPMRPRPMAEDDLIRFFQVIDARRERTIFLLMRRCGLRVGDVTRMPWAAIDGTQGTIRVNDGQGRVDRVVSCSPDLETVLRQWRRPQWPPLPLMCPSAHRLGTPVRIRPIQPAMSRDRKAAGITRRDAPHTLRPSLRDPAPQGWDLAGSAPGADGAPLHHPDVARRPGLCDHQADTIGQGHGTDRAAPSTLRRTAHGRHASPGHPPFPGVSPAPPVCGSYHHQLYPGSAVVLCGLSAAARPCLMSRRRAVY
jgi:site-specific recombinase XerC